MLIEILIGMTAVIAILLVVVALQPAAYSISRSATLAAPPAKVFALVNDMRRWNEWSPWAKVDPSQTVAFEGPASGVGAVQTWKGKKTGTGRMELVKSEPDRAIGFSFVMKEPMASTAEMAFALAPAGEGTTVTWRMTGQNNFMAKAFGLMMNMDKMMGAKFEEGLVGIKAIVETPGGK